MDQLIDRSTATRLRRRLATDPTRAKWALVALLAGIALVVGGLLGLLTPVVGIAALMAAVGGLLMLRDVRWGLYALLAVICLLPFASLPFSIGFTPTLLDLAFGALYAVWGMRLITRRQDDFILTPVGLPVLVFVTLAVFSFVLGLFFLAVNQVREPSLLRRLTAVIILAGGAEAAIGVSLYLLPQSWALRLLSPLGRLGYPVGFGALRFINDDPERPMRAIGTSIDPNILGALLVVVVAIAAAQLFARRPVLPRIWLAAALGMMGICLFYTYSRASMAGAVVALGIIALLKHRRLLVVLVIAGVLLLLLPQTQAYVSHFVEGIRIEDRSTQMRMGEYRDAFRLISRYPWIGVGFVGTPDIDLYLAVASIYLALLSKMGVVGLLTFLLVMASFFVYLFRAWRVLPPNAPLEPFLLGYGSAVLGSLGSGVLDHTLLTYPHAVALFWLVLGLGAVAARLSLAGMTAAPD
jgi:hypothetical protein